MNVRALLVMTVCLAPFGATVARADDGASTAGPLALPPPPPPPSAAPTIAPKVDAPDAPTLKPLLEVFAQYRLRATTAENGDSTWFHEFVLGRAFAGIEASWHGATGKVILEALRSANDGGLVGVAGNAFVFAAREAWAGYQVDLPNGAGVLRARAGIVPGFFVPVVESAWKLRVLERTTFEASGLAFASDVGAQVTYELPKKLGTVGVGAENGESYLRPELNRGKNFVAAATIHPLATLRGGEPFTLMVGTQVGSIGTASARANRWYGGLFWIGERISVGVTGVYALGVADDGTKTSAAFDAFARVEPVKNLLVGARFALWLRDTRTSGDSTSQLLFSVGYRIVEPLEVHAAFVRTWVGSGALAALPGDDGYDGRIAARVHF
jgi:hypothetical protein